MSAAKTAHLCYYFAKKLCDIYKAVSIEHIKLTFPFIGQAKKTKQNTTTHQNKHAHSLSWDQTVCRALGGKEGEKRNTWPALHKEHPLWTTQRPADTQRHTPTCTNCYIQRYIEIQYLLFIWQNRCTVLQMNVHTSKAHRHIIMTSLLATQWTNKDKQTADSHNGCHKNTRPYSSALSLSLLLAFSLSRESRNRRSEGFREMEWKRVCGWVPTLNRKQKKKKKQHQNMSEWIITIPRHRGMVWEDGGEERRKEGRKEEAGG